MNLDLLESQKNLIDFLASSYNKKRLSHAYIFEGDKGVGKNELAHFFACLLYQEDELNLNSNTSRLILNDEHLNVFTIYPSGKVIKKEQIVELQEEFSKKSLVSGPRIYIINESEKMNISSQNSLLKFIEEPQPNIYGILCTTNSNLLLPTIVSRCQKLRLNNLDRDLIIKELRKRDISKENASLLSLLTNDIDKAYEMNKDASVLNIIKMFNSFFSIKQDKDVIKHFLELSKICTTNEQLNNYIKLLIVLYEDLLYLLKGNLNIKLKEYSNNIAKLMNRINEDKALKSIEYLYDTSKKLNSSNVSVKNIITGLMFNLM